TGLGGALAVANYMHRDLVERRGWIGEDDYRTAFAIAQILPGPLTPQLAMFLAYLLHGFAGAVLAVLGLVGPSVLAVLAPAAVSAAHGELWWIRALFWGIAPATLAVMALSGYRLARRTNERDPLLWALSAALAVVTVVLQTELVLSVGFVIAGLVVLVREAPPRWRGDIRRAPAVAFLPTTLLARPMLQAPPTVSGDLLLQMLVVFGQAGLLGSGMGMVPLLQQGVVVESGWLTERQFLDSLAIGYITPGPSATISAFMGYLLAGLPGAAVATLGTFGPVCLMTLAVLPWCGRHRENPQLRAFARGAAAASLGALVGAGAALVPGAIPDPAAAGLAAASLLVLWRFRLP